MNLVVFDPAGVSATLAAIRARVPLVHNITNLVVTNSTANALLALGASPAMVEGAEEVAEFVAVAQSLVINLGTMSAARAQSMRIAAGAAMRAGKPWVLDPVAVGAIAYRSAVAVELLAFAPSVIRGNASEIIALAQDGAGGSAGRGVDSIAGRGVDSIAGRGVDSTAGRGVDSIAASGDARAAARLLARAGGGVVVVSGATDYVTDGNDVIAIENGHPMMARVTGMGCTATAIIGACLAVEPDALAAAVHGMVMIGLAGEIAAETATGPGSLQVDVLDALYALDTQTILARAKVLLSA